MLLSVKNNQLGDWFDLLGSLVNVGGSIGGALITTGAQESIAEKQIQSQTQIAQMQLHAQELQNQYNQMMQQISAGNLVTTQAGITIPGTNITTVSPVSQQTGNVILPSNKWLLIGGGVLLVLLLKR